MMKVQQDGVTRAYRKITTETDYELKPSIREKFDKLPPDSKIPIPVRLPALDLIKDILLDYETFWAIRENDVIPPLEAPPIFEKNAQAYWDLVLTRIFDRRLGDEVKNVEKATAGELVKSMQELKSMTAVRDAGQRLIHHPFFYIAQNYDPKVSETLDDVEIALLENGYPDANYKRWIRETAPDPKILEMMSERFLKRMSAQEIRRRIDRNNGASYSLENYAVTEPDGTTLRDIVLSSKEVLQYDLDQMPPLHAPLEEILKRVGKNSGPTADFIKFVEKYWTDTRVISTLSRMQNVDEVLEFFERMLEKHVTYNPSSAGPKQNVNKIKEDFIRLWFYGERRLCTEKKIAELTTQINGRFRPKSPYTMFAVENPKGNIIYYEYLNTLFNDNTQKINEKNQLVLP
jgi:pentatricopeptide repeat protein